MNLYSENIKEALQALAIPEKAAFLPKFFKTGIGEYGEGDQFLGVKVPDQRAVAKDFYLKTDLKDLSSLLSSPVHEHRLTALFILILKFENTKDHCLQKELVDFYLSHLEYVNNWDLADTSCYKILGRYAFENQREDLLINLAASQNMWHKRIAVVGTMYFVKKGNYFLTKDLVLKNLHHSHDLMHKANGWLLREIGNKNREELLDFLNIYYQKMPRTTLRYAIEKLDEPLRQDYLKGRI